MLDLESLYSDNANNMKKSVIRELLKLTNQPGIISFAGGLPAPRTFPVEGLRAAADRVFANGRPRRSSTALPRATTSSRTSSSAFEAQAGRSRSGRDECSSSRRASRPSTSPARSSSTRATTS